MKFRLTPTCWEALQRSHFLSCLLKNKLFKWLYFPFWTYLAFIDFENIAIAQKNFTILHKLTFCCQCGYGCGHWSCLSVVMFMVLRPMTMPNADGLRCQHWFTCWLEIIACVLRCFAGSGLLTWTCPAPSFKWAAFPSISRFDTETFKTFKMLKSGWGGDEGQEEAAPTVLPSSHCTGLNILTNILTNISNISSSSRFPCLPTYLLLLFYIQDSGGWMEEAAKTESEKQRAEPPDPG